MTSRRVLKSAEAIREVVSMAILMEIKDPRVQNVTVTYVEVSPDMRYAKVHVSVMGDEARQQLSLRGLQSAAGFLQSKIAKRIDTRYTPRLQFVLDQGVKHSIKVSQILSELFPHGTGEAEGQIGGEEDLADQAVDEPDDQGEAAGEMLGEIPGEDEITAGEETEWRDHAGGQPRDKEQDRE